MKLTPEERKQREIAKWEKEQQKSKLPGYLIYFLLVICVVYVCDEVVSQIGTQMQSVVASQLFAPIVGEEIAVARMSALGLVLLLPSAIAVVYKPLCDRFGRIPGLLCGFRAAGREDESRSQRRKESFFHVVLLFEKLIILRLSHKGKKKSLLLPNLH